jgi:fumarate hydratase subunit alpha
MREIHVSDVSSAVSELCKTANKTLPVGVKNSIHNAVQLEDNALCKEVLGDLLRNLDAAERLDVPICQDTGMAVVFLELGQDVHIVGGDLYTAVNVGVREGYVGGLLRLSVVADPLRRVNTNDNTPAIIHTDIVPGDTLKITVAPKGFGSENMSRIKMFNPTAERSEIVEFIAETAKVAGSNPCPPIILGVGLGGNFEGAALLAKKALLRDPLEDNADEFYKSLEQEALAAVNATGIGAQGFGGKITALGVNLLAAPTHIAGLPCAVNVSCHVTRHATMLFN